MQPYFDTKGSRLFLRNRSNRSTAGPTRLRAWAPFCASCYFAFSSSKLSKEPRHQVTLPLPSTREQGTRHSLETWSCGTPRFLCPVLPSRRQLPTPSAGQKTSRPSGCDGCVTARWRHVGSWRWVSRRSGQKCLQLYPSSGGGRFSPMG